MNTAVIKKNKCLAIWSSPMLLLISMFYVFIGPNLKSFLILNHPHLLYVDNMSVLSGIMDSLYKHIKLCIVKLHSL